MNFKQGDQGQKGSKRLTASLTAKIFACTFFLSQLTVTSCPSQISTSFSTINLVVNASLTFLRKVNQCFLQTWSSFLAQLPDSRHFSGD